jgi:hypothetical protein
LKWNNIDRLVHNKAEQFTHGGFFYRIQDLKAPEVKIKWPNDLYAKGLKVGGVLYTSTYSAKKFHIVVGMLDKRRLYCWPLVSVQALLHVH